MTELLIGLAGALLGGLIHYLIQNYLNLHTADVDLINNQIEQIGRIEKAGVDYWHHDPTDAEGEDKRLASLLNGEMTSSSYFEKDAKRLMKLKYSKYEALDGELYDMATGGDFQTKAKAVDCERVIGLMAKCHELRAFLRKTRRSVYWAR